MDAKQKEEIAHLRMQGMTYEQMSKQLHLSVNTVKSYCQRNQLGGRKQAVSEKYFCRQCGAEVIQIPHRKLKKFCSDKCRMKWWNVHPEKLHRKSGKSIVCPICENVFLPMCSQIVNIALVNAMENLSRRDRSAERKIPQYHDV